MFTTAKARVRLYGMLGWLDPSQLIYCDTDSVIFAYDKNNPLHKCPNNTAIDLPNNVRFGNALGEWEDEFKDGEYITEVVVGGAKTYSYITNKNDENNEQHTTIAKQKGITLHRANSNKFTIEHVKHMVLNNGVIQSEERFQFIYNNTTKDVETRYISRSVKNYFRFKTIIN